MKTETRIASIFNIGPKTNKIIGGIYLDPRGVKFYRPDLGSNQSRYDYHLLPSDIVIDESVVKSKLFELVLLTSLRA